MTQPIHRLESDLNLEVAAKIAAFKSVFIPYPRHVELHRQLDYLQQLGKQTRGQPQMGLRVLAPTGSGKSTAANAYIDQVEQRRPKTEEFIPIIKIDLERGSTSKKLMMSILHAFGDLYASHGNELLLKRRVFACFERFSTELLMVDEVQHLNFRNGAKNDVTDTLKGILDVGIVPMVFLGTENAAPMFHRNLQLNGRLLPPCDLPPLDARRSGDQKLFSRFVLELEKAVVDQGILAQPSNLTQSGLIPAIFEVSSGVIGRVSRLFEAALTHAIRRDAKTLGHQDLSWAVEHWAIPNAFINYNPMTAAAGD